MHVLMPKRYKLKLLPMEWAHYFLGVEVEVEVEVR